jgi:putative transposase
MLARAPSAGAFQAFVMDERHLIAATRYVERNPVRARLCARREDWPWSSARAHPAGADDELVGVRPLLELISDRVRFIGETDATDIADLLHAHAGIGRSLGPDSFLEDPEQCLGRPLKRQKPGPKASPRDSSTGDLFELPERN